MWICIKRQTSAKSLKNRLSLSFATPSIRLLSKLQANLTQVGKELDPPVPPRYRNRVNSLYLPAGSFPATGRSQYIYPLIRGITLTSQSHFIQIKAIKETHLLDVFDFPTPVIHLRYTFKFHTSNTFSDPSIQLEE